MSNRWKRRRPRNRTPHATPTGRGEILRVKTFAGTFVGEARGSEGWMVLHSYEVNPKYPLPLVLQSSSCPATGETLCKPIEGRYMHLSEEELSGRIAELEAVWRRAGGLSFSSHSLPAWFELESLENMLEFELHPPCGCPSKLRLASA